MYLNGAKRKPNIFLINKCDLILMYIPKNTIHNIHIWEIILTYSVNYIVNYIDRTVAFNTPPTTEQTIHIYSYGNTGENIDNIFL